MGWLAAALRRGSGGPGPAVAVTLSDWFAGVPTAGAGRRGAGPAGYLPEWRRGQAAAGGGVARGLPVICRSGSAARLPRVMMQVLTRKPSREDPLDRAPALIMAH